jgi:capsular polysaccharide biosynthesis protein
MHRLASRRSRAAALVIAVLTTLGLVGGWLVAEVRGPSYDAQTNVLVQFGQVQAFLLTGQSSAVSIQDVADAGTLATSPDVLDLAAERLDDGLDGDDLAALVTATGLSSSNGFTLTATADTAEDAEALSSAVAQATIDTQQQRISDSAASLAALADGDLKTIIQQRAQILVSSVQPLEVLRTAAATNTRSTLVTTLALGIVGLAAGVLLLVGVHFARPVVSRPRDAQRLTERPSVAFEPSQASPEAGALVHRLLETRPGEVLVVPVDAAAAKSAEVFAEWARSRAESTGDGERIVVTTEPITAVLAPRPPAPADMAVVLVVPQGVAARTVSDAVSLLGTWRAADAVVVSA